MKKWISLLLVLCMLLSACGPAGTEQPGETVDSDVQTGEGSTSSAQEETSAAERPSLDHEIVITAPIGGVGIPDSDLVLGESGRIRIDYTGDRNSVRYVTDVTGIPAYPELAGYDEAYFAEKALLLVHPGHRLLPRDPGAAAQCEVQYGRERNAHRRGDLPAVRAG